MQANLAALTAAVVLIFVPIRTVMNMPGSLGIQFEDPSISTAKQLTMEQVARRALLAIEKSDGEELLKYLSAPEVERLSLTKENLNLLLKDYYRPIMAGYKPDSDIRVEDENPGWVTVTRSYRNEKGWTTAFSVLAGETPKGPKIVGCVASLAISPSAVTVPSPDAIPRTAQSRYGFWAAHLRKYLPVLKKTGIKGLLRQRVPEPKDEYFTFEEFMERAEKISTGSAVGPVGM